jgi:Mrp family chromosome partitioning ATPase
MLQPTSNPSTTAETIPNLGATRPVGRAGAPIPQAQAPGWRRAWRSCWHRALAVAIFSGSLLALLADLQQPRTFERVALVHIAPPADDTQLTVAAQVHHLRALGEQHGLAIGEGTGGDVEIRLSGNYPAVLGQHLQTTLERHRMEMAARQKQIGSQLAAELARIETQLKEVPQGPAKSDQEARQVAKRDLEQAEKNRREVEAELAEFNKHNNLETSPLSPGLAEKLLRGDLRAVPLLEKRAKILADMVQVERVAAPSNREAALRPYRIQLSKVEEQLADLLVRLEQPIREQVRVRWEAERKEQLARLTDELNTARLTEQAARRRLEALQTMPITAGSKALEERVRLEERRQQLVAEVRTLDQAGSDPGGFQVREETTRETRALTRLIGTLLAGLLGGLGFGVIVVARQRADGKVRRTKELGESTGFQILGRLPLVSGDALPIPGVQAEGTAGQELQRLTEAADELRGPVLRQLPAGPVRLLVTSPGAGDGRTTLATQLACSLARAGKRVLLVDGSIGRTDLAWLFQLNPEPGLAEVLRGEVEVGSVLQATSFSRLLLLPAGHADTQAQAALVQDWSAHLFEPILAQVDCIVIDGPSLENGPEASAWAGRCQAVLVAVRAGHTPLVATHAACQRLHLLRAPVLGLVLLERAPGERSP